MLIANNKNEALAIDILGYFSEQLIRKISAVIFT